MLLAFQRMLDHRLTSTLQFQFLVTVTERNKERQKAGEKEVEIAE